MRIHLRLSPNRCPVNFDHLPVLAGMLHKWLGPNTQHDGFSLYSFSWLKDMLNRRDGFAFVTLSIAGMLCDCCISWGVSVQTVRPLFRRTG